MSIFKNQLQHTSVHALFVSCCCSWWQIGSSWAWEIQICHFPQVFQLSLWLSLILQRRWIGFKQGDKLCRVISLLLILLTGCHLFSLYLGLQTCIHSVLIISSPVNIFQSCRSLPAHSHYCSLALCSHCDLFSKVHTKHLISIPIWSKQNVLPVFIRLLVQFNLTVLLHFVFLFGHCSYSSYISLQIL